MRETCTMSVSAELSGVCTMALAFLLFFLLRCTGSFSQPVLTQLPSAIASLGDSVKISCILDSEHSNYNIGWYQQHPDKAPKNLMQLNSDGSHSKRDGIPDRFSGSSSGPHRNLIISSIQPEDEADYFCVSDQPKVTPTVTLYSPPSEELKNKKVTLVCRIDDFYPGVVTLTWKADGTPITDGLETSKTWKKGDKYMAISSLTWTEEEWKSISSVSCEVTHEGDTVEKTLYPSVCF